MLFKTCLLLKCKAYFVFVSVFKRKKKITLFLSSHLALVILPSSREHSHVLGVFDSETGQAT